MAATAYLCVTGLMRLSPSSRDPRFDPARNTIAQATGSVPLFWMGLFRPGDLKRQAVRPIDGGPEDAAYALAPIASVDRAMSQLTQAVPAIEALFGKQWGDVAGSVRLFSRALLGTGLPYVTVELDEIEAGFDPLVYRERMRRVLRWFDAPDRELDKAGIVSELVTMCGVDTAALDRTAVLGTKHERAVPWE